MKTLAALILAGSIAPQAHAFKCKVDIIGAGCATPEVSVEIKEGKFAVVNGDLTCWFANFGDRGDAVQVQSVYPFANLITYEMQLKRAKAQLIHDPVKQVARLTYAELPEGQLGTKYDLKCEE
jgi:hypothetical protein